jgi:hypothetical protein
MNHRLTCTPVHLDSFIRIETQFLRNDLPTWNGSVISVQNEHIFDERAHLRKLDGNFNMVLQTLNGRIVFLGRILVFRCGLEGEYLTSL